jgi:mRNA interferase MazF
MNGPGPARGDIWTVDLNPFRGHEQAGVRPALVVSVDPFNQGPAGLVIVVPLTTRDRRIRAHVPIDPPEGGLVQRSFAMCEAIRSIAKERLGRRWGAGTVLTMRAVEDGLRILQGL